MAHEASDGQKFTNLPPMKAHQRGLDAKMGKKDPLKMPGGDEGDMGEGEDAAGVVKEHGPAIEVNITHDHMAGKHSVHSKHEDGHEHHSDHPDAEAAGEHGKDLGMPAEDEGEGENEHEMQGAEFE